MAQKRILLIALAAVLLVSGIVCLVIAGSRRMPSYHGKSLEYWLGQMPVTLITVITTTNSGMTLTFIGNAGKAWAGRPAIMPAINEQPEDCLLAMKTMGTNTLPILLAKLQVRDNPWKDRINEWRTKAGIKRYVFEPAEWTRGKAITGLEALQPLPESVQQQLRALSTNADLSIAEAAKYALLGKPVDFGVGSTVNSVSRTIGK